ncbi:MAG TPA: NAD(P)H:quinone oxidoreductase [Steroidobacteraceae bacterium]|nr:NAD(P)H:quinone oxidoreductase [Steroidobacteraceae bacterium]
MLTVLVLYYSRNGSTAALARQVCRGVDSVDGVTAMLRTVPPVCTVIDAPAAPVPPDGPPYASHEDLARCDGLVLGSPTRFGNMAAPLKYFLDGTGAAWASGELVGKPAGVFTSTSTQHGGHESTLLSMMLPLLHHGMLVCGLPFTEPAVARTARGGGPYGAGAIGRTEGGALDEDEKLLAQHLGRRVAEVAVRLAPPRRK